MIRCLVYGGLLMILLTSCSSYQRQLRSYPPHCQQLLQELKYRIIKNDTGGYTFRFEYPVSDTIPKSETPRGMEFINFTKHVLTDTLCQCNIDYEIITSIIGKPDKKYIWDKQNNFISIYYLDFGYNCGGDKCSGTDDNECNSYKFLFNLEGKLIQCFGSIQTFDIEPLYCTSNAWKYLESKEKKK